MTTPNGQELLDELNALRASQTKLQEANAEQASTIARQHAQLVDPANIQPAPAPQNQEDLSPLDQLMGQIESAMDRRLAPLQDQINANVSLVKSATPEAEVWGLTQVAQEIKNSDPGISGENALKLAKIEMAERAEEQANLKEQADLAATRNNADAASMGNRNNTNAIAPNTDGSLTRQQSFDKRWDEHGMTEKHTEHVKNTDNNTAWAPPKSTTATQII